MLELLPIGITIVVWSLFVLTVLVRTIRVLRGRTAGHKTVSAHLTADFISLGVGLASAIYLHHLIASRISLGGLVGFAIYFLTAIICSIVTAGIYRRVLDGRVRRFLEAGSPEASVEEGPSL